jgi:phosphatidylglycerophosphate synthase
MQQSSTQSYIKWLPNTITLSRLILGILAFIAALQQYWVSALWLILAAITTDFFDGLVARKFNVASKFGEEFDAITDSLIVTLGVLGLGITGQISWWLLAAIFAASLVISSDRIFNQPDWPWRTMLAVSSLFVAWVGIVWFYASLAYGWSWFYIPMTILVLVICALLKRKRIAVWLKPYLH